MKDQKTTPMLRQFLDIKEKHPDKIILFRMGDFYETFYDDAVLASKVLSITLTSRNKKNDAAVPLAGIPYHALDNYLDKLIKAGHKVVIAEQTEDPKLAKGLVKREVVDVITPGSVVESELLQNEGHNFLAACVKATGAKNYGVAFIDVSTGDFIWTICTKTGLKQELERLTPAELVVADQDLLAQVKGLATDHSPVYTLFEDPFFDLRQAQDLLTSQFGVNTLEGFGLKHREPGVLACGLALAYLASLKTDTQKQINRLSYYSLDNQMQLDETTRRNLELFKSIRTQQREGSLLHALDTTCTPMGGRLLHMWLSGPLLDKKQIEQRLELVQIFIDGFHITSDLRAVLDNVGDLSRLLSKVGAGRINPREALSLASFLDTATELTQHLGRYNATEVEPLGQNIANYDEIVTYLHSAICELPAVTITDGGIIADGFHQELDELRGLSKSGKSAIAALEAKEKQETGIPSLKVGYNRVFGYYIEVTKTHADKIPAHYIRKQTLVNSERYISPALKEHENKVLGAEERIKTIEHDLFLEIRKYLLNHLQIMQAYADVVAELDVLACFAWLAREYRWCRPQFNTQGVFKLEQSRHPVVEKLITSEQYIPNDIYLNDDDYRIALITGPNMAGKSTYLRQAGLIAIMAQCGSFVPAATAQLPVFDKVFTRVGASDNLAGGQSTFLVEMLETANILNNATPQSLVLLDEIGRGTSTFDGLSLAWSIMEFIHNNRHLRCKTLFATHYHELTELEAILPGVKNYNIAVKKYNDQMIFLRKIERGGADQSYGVEVAQLAGIPKAVISRAKQILKNLEYAEISPQGVAAQARKQLADSGTGTGQISIFEPLFEQSDKQNKLLEEIRNFDLNRTSPIQALSFLAELQDKLNKGD